MAYVWQLPSCVVVVAIVATHRPTLDPSPEVSKQAVLPSGTFASIRWAAPRRLLERQPNAAGNRKSVREGILPQR